MTEGDPPRADYSGRRMELSIKECPAEVGLAFIEFARAKWHGKQWVALKALLQAAENEENWKVMAERLAELHATVERHDFILSKVGVNIVPAPPREEPEKEEEKKEEKKPATFASARQKHGGEN